MLLRVVYEGDGNANSRGRKKKNLLGMWILGKRSMSDGFGIRKGEGKIEASSGNQTRMVRLHCSRIPMFVNKGRTD
jgi:hypothetical protein